MARIKVNEDFSEFLRLCLDYELRFMMIGGYAVVHHSRPRYTGDIDLWVDSSQENAERVVKVLRDFGFPGYDVTTEMITGEKEIIRMGFEPTLGKIRDYGLAPRRGEHGLRRDGHSYASMMTSLSPALIAVPGEMATSVTMPGRGVCGGL